MASAVDRLLKNAPNRLSLVVSYLKALQKFTVPTLKQGKIASCSSGGVCKFDAKTQIVTAGAALPAPKLGPV